MSAAATLCCGQITRRQVIIVVVVVSDNGNPFKGPFKGKRENARALRELEAELASIHDEMRAVVGRFNERFRPPRPVSLRILGRRQWPLLWWRVPGASGTYIRLLDSDRGLSILESLMPQARKALMEFERERIRLNFRSGVVGNAVESYRRRERDLALLESMQGK